MLESLRAGRLPGPCQFHLCELSGHRQGLDVQYPGPGRWLVCTCKGRFTPPATAPPVRITITVAAVLVAA